MKTEPIKRLYYSISEVGKKLELEPHVLRYWETEFEQLRPRKNRSGRRIYTESDIAIATRIKNLLRIDKYTIEGARQVLAGASGGVASEENFRNELVQVRQFLKELLSQLA